MKKFLKENFIIIVFIFLILSLLKNCNDVRSLNEMRDSNTELSIYLKDSIYNKIDIDKKFEILKIDNKINGYEVSYRMLYDNNYVIRTKERPDDIMNNYVEKINELERKLYERLVR